MEELTIASRDLGQLCSMIVQFKCVGCFSKLLECRAVRVRRRHYTTRAPEACGSHRQNIAKTVKLVLQNGHYQTETRRVSLRSRNTQCQCATGACVTVAGPQWPNRARCGTLSREQSKQPTYYIPTKLSP